GGAGHRLGLGGPVGGRFGRCRSGPGSTLSVLLKILVLGGTVFLGRHLVEAALERGHQVAMFNRGRSNPELFPDVDRLVGDRDGDLAALDGGAWDAVVDLSGFLPRQVRTVAE